MTNSVVSGSIAMIQPAWHHVSGSNDHRAGELYQTSLMSALIAGIYESEATYGQIRKCGDFGLGTFNDLDGEMVAFDGTFYQLRSDGSARPVTGDQKTPFAVVTFFQPEQELDVIQPVVFEIICRRYFVVICRKHLITGTHPSRKARPGSDGKDLQVMKGK
jgi:hypothetical protein